MHRNSNCSSFLAFGCFLLSAISANAGDPPIQGDLVELQGDWKVKLDDEVTILLEIQNNHTTSSGTLPGGQKVRLRYDIRLDERTSPRSWDWVGPIGPDGRKIDDQFAIYKLDGDTLTLCVAPSTRPTEFKAGKNGIPALKVYHRVVKP